MPKPRNGEADGADGADGESSDGGSSEAERNRELNTSLPWCLALIRALKPLDSQSSKAPSQGCNQGPAVNTTTFGEPSCPSEKLPQ